MLHNQQVSVSAGLVTDDTTEQTQDHSALTLLKLGAPSVLGAPSASLSMPSKASVIALSSETAGAILFISRCNWEQSQSWQSPDTDSQQGTDTPGQVKHRNLAAD